MLLCGNSLEQGVSQLIEFKCGGKNLLHWDTKLDSVWRLFFSRPHQCQEPVGSEDPQLGVAQLVERVSKRRETHSQSPYDQLIQQQSCNHIEF